MENCRQLSTVAEANLTIETFVQAAIAFRDFRTSKNLTMIQRWPEVPAGQLVVTSMLSALGQHVTDMAMETSNLVFSWCCALLQKGCADDLLALPASTRAKFGHASEAALVAASIVKARKAKGEEEDEASLFHPTKIDSWCDSRVILREALNQTQQLASLDVKALEEILPDMADCVAKHRDTLSANLRKLVEKWQPLLLDSKTFIESAKPLEDCIEKWDFSHEALSLTVDDGSPEGVRNEAACRKAVENLELLRSLEGIISCMDDVQKLVDDHVLERKVAAQIQKCKADSDTFGSFPLAQAILQMMAVRTLLEQGVASSVVERLSQYISTVLKVPKKKWPKQISDRIGKILKDAAKEAKENKKSSKDAAAAAKALSVGARPKGRAGASTMKEEKPEQKEQQTADNGKEEQEKQNGIAEAEAGASNMKEEKPEQKEQTAGNGKEEQEKQNGIAEAEAGASNMKEEKPEQKEQTAGNGKEEQEKQNGIAEPATSAESKAEAAPVADQKLQECGTAATAEAGDPSQSGDIH